ncbi:hypothetical protein D3C72_2371490 [compost metagenome]
MLHGLASQEVFAAGAHGLFLEGDPPWRMARTAMPEALHQVGAAVCCLVFARISDEGLGIDK